MQGCRGDPPDEKKFEGAEKILTTSRQWSINFFEKRLKPLGSLALNTNTMYW
jgi:hypothetical protein